MHTFLVLGAVFAGVAVALGAFGAHALRDKVTADKLAVYQTGVQYQMYHGFALIAVGLLAAIKGVTPPLTYAGWLFTVGIVLFSGSLYILTGSRSKAIGIVTPFGGLAFMVGWVLFIVAALHA